MSFTPRTLDDLAHEFPPDIEYLSATGMKVALRCFEQYRRIYIKGMRKAPSLALCAGSADHKSVEESLRSKMDTQEALESGHVAGRFLEEIEARVDEVGGLRELEDAPDVKVWDQVRTVGQDGVRKYNDVMVPRIVPVGIEESFTLPVPNVPVPLVGYLDVVAFDPLGELRIIDRKRAGRAPYKAAADWQFQARIYQLHKPVPHEWHVTVAPKRGTQATLHPDPFTMEVANQKATEKQVAMIAQQIGALYQRYGPDDEWPASGVTHPFACGYCGFRDECWYWKEV